jgi:serine O-acetyltransferase
MAQLAVLALNSPQHIATDCKQASGRVFDNIRADFRAHGRRLGAQGLWAMAVYRFGRWRYTIPTRVLRLPFSLVYRVAFKFVQIVTGIELPCEVKVGRNFVIDHFGGIVISGFARFGDDCRIRTGVVVGLARIEEPCAPVFGNNVDIGTGAKVLGPIVVGDNVLIGANAVVIRDVPPDSVVTGVPGRVKPRKSRSAKEPGTA